jgi:hypothetical protein
MSNLPTEQSENDPLATLHKMSRTAGAGTQEYVAINATSVAAFLLGLASALAIVGQILLIIPFLTIFVAVIAIYQIRRSGGTQSGMGLAVTGVVLALGFVAFVGGKQVVDSRRDEIERQQIISMMQQLGNDFAAKNYDAAWQKFSSRFKENVTRERFEADLARLQASSYYGPIKSITSNNVSVPLSYGGELPIWQSIFIITVQSGQEDRRMITFRKYPDEGWRIDEIEGFFPASQKPPPAG